MPFDDWQFYLVSGFALVGIWMIIRALRSDGLFTGRCRKCCRDGSSKKSASRPTTLTIHGKRS